MNLKAFWDGTTSAPYILVWRGATIWLNVAHKRLRYTRINYEPFPPNGQYERP